MPTDHSGRKRVFIRTHIHRLGEDISPVVLFRITTKETHKYEKDGWKDIMVSIRHQGDKVYIRYTGIKSEGMHNATQNSNREAEETSKVHPILEAIRQAFKIFRKRPS